MKTTRWNMRSIQSETNFQKQIVSKHPYFLIFFFNLNNWTTENVKRKQMKEMAYGLILFLCSRIVVKTQPEVLIKRKFSSSLKNFTRIVSTIHLISQLLIFHPRGWMRNETTSETRFSTNFHGNMNSCPQGKIISNILLGKL